MTTPDLIHAIGETTDPLNLMRRVSDRTLELIASARGVMVGLIEDSGEAVTYVCGSGNQGPYVGTRVEVGSSLSGLALRTGQTQQSDDTRIDPRVDREACRRLSATSLICVPLRRRDETLGVLAVNAPMPGAFSAQHVAMLSRIADFVSVVIGSAFDMSRVRAQLLGITDADGDGLDGEVSGSDDATNRYIMGVLNPDRAERIDASVRIRQIVDDPQSLSMVFQPIIDLVSNQIAAFEALARFAPTPYRSPDVWFAEAHACGLGVELELLAVTRACAHLHGIPRDVPLAINAGPPTIVSRRFQDIVLGASPERIVLELTEHSAVENYPELIGALAALRQAGVRIAIDDAGSGYSGLAHILKLAPDYIKLDRDLVSGIDVDPVRRALAASLATFAADTGARIVAEGVENEDELDVLRGLNVRYVQGYHLARPGPLEAHLAWKHQPARESPRPASAPVDVP